MIDATVERIVTARRTGQPVAASSVQLADAEGAYVVQQQVAAAMGWFDAAPPGHWKSGGPSRDAVLTHAALPPDGVFDSPADLTGRPFLMRGIEAEIAFRLRCDVDPELARSVDHRQAAELIDAICVAIEIVDSRWTEGLAAPALAKLADLQSHGALVLGNWLPYRACDWSEQACCLRIGERLAVEPRGSHPLHDPTFVLPAWLRHATRDGDRVAAGTVVTTGTWVGIVEAAAGESVSVEFPGIGQASVRL